MNLRTKALQMHEMFRGKMETSSKIKVEKVEDLSLAYSPGVAEPCREIVKNASLVYAYTNKGNTVAVVTDGSAVLGLGDIGPEAALPVMEGKAVLFKVFAGIDAYPLAVSVREARDIIEVVAALAPSFAGVNLEDIAAPRCFEIEKELQERVGIPVFHDDQHGTAVVCLAGLLNALRVVGKDLAGTKIVINGAGAAGCAIAGLLAASGASRLRICDREGILYPGRKNMNRYKEEIAVLTNPAGEKGDLASALQGAGVFLGVSAAGAVTGEMVQKMAPRPVVFAMANPDPEIMPEAALAAGAGVVGTGRSDYPNQINNVLGFPGIFRGALEVRARRISEEMKLSAARAIAALVPEDRLSPGYVLPNPLDKRVVPAVAWAVARTALKEGLAADIISKEELRTRLAARFGNW